MADLARMTKSAMHAVTDSKPAKDADPKGLAAAGVAMAVLPIAVEQIAKRVAPKVSELGDQAKQTAKQTAKAAATEKLKPQGLGGGLLSKLTPGSSDEGSKNGGHSEGEQGRAAPGHGSGRRMPIQQGVNVAVPLKVAYNQWTQFEDWPEFMHRPESVEQVDDATLAISTKVWGIRRRFQAKILEQRPDERIEWNVEEGLSHTGVVTFHELSDRLTRIEVTVDVEPHGLLEKAGRGMRFAKRAVRGGLHRFKAFVELNEEAEGGWRGTIEDGGVKRRTERQPSSRSRSSRRGHSSNGSRASSSSSGSRSRTKGRSGARSTG